MRTPILLAAALLVAADWPQFRGPDSRGWADDGPAPVKWSKTENLAWTAELPGKGIGCPVIVGGRVFVTASSGYQEHSLHVLCFDAGSGKRLWERTLASTGDTQCHPDTNMAAPTPVADAEGVYALFATGDLAAFANDGTLRWYRSLVGDHPTIINQIGMASSPVLAGGVLVVPMDNNGESFLAGVDTATGQDRWKAERPRGINWTTPAVAARNGQPEVLFQNGGSLIAYDPVNGSRKWEYINKDLNSISSLSVAGDGLILTSAGRGGAMVLKPGAEKPDWTAAKVAAGMSSPLAYRGRVYAVTGNGVVACADLKDGKVLWQERVKGQVTGSPVAADGKVYVTTKEGVTTVFAAGDTAKVLATNDLGAGTGSTPAVAGGRFYLRTDAKLYCVR